MLVVATTTSTAAARMLAGQLDGFFTQLHNTGAARNLTAMINSGVQAALILSMLACAAVVIVAGAVRVWMARFGSARPMLRPLVAVE